MKAVLSRVRRLEAQLGPQLKQDLIRNPRQRLRIVVARMDRALNWTTSRCRRYLSSQGCLTEIVRLDGIRSGISDEELESFIGTFPVETS